MRKYSGKVTSEWRFNIFGPTKLWWEINNILVQRRMLSAVQEYILGGIVDAALTRMAPDPGPFANIRISARYIVGDSLTPIARTARLYRAKHGVSSMRSLNGLQRTPCLQERIPTRSSQT